MTKRPRKLLTEFLFENIVEFRDFKSINEIQEFTENKIKSHSKFGVKSAEDVFSLLLNIAIILFDVEIIKFILNSNLINHKNNILTILDERNLCPLYSALTSNKEILDLVQEYIKKHQKEFSKYEIPEEDIKRIANWIPLIPNDYSCSANFHNLIEPLYCESSVIKLIKYIGEENFDVNNFL